MHQGERGKRVRSSMITCPSAPRSRPRLTSHAAGITRRVGAKSRFMSNKIPGILGSTKAGRRAMAFLVLGLLSVVPALAIACGSSKAPPEAVGSSVAAITTAASSPWSKTNTTIPLDNAWSTHTAAGDYRNAAGSPVSHHLTFFTGDFAGTNTPGYVMRDINSAMSNITQVTTTVWGTPTLGDGYAAASYQSPSTVEYLHVTGQWIAFSQATSTHSGLDIVAAITNNGGTNWPTVVSLSQLELDTGAIAGKVGTIVAAVDQSTTAYTVGTYTTLGGFTNAGGNFNNLYLYYTIETPGTPVSMYLNMQLMFVDSNNRLFFLGGIGNNNGACLLGVGDPWTTGCFDTTYAANTLNMVVGHETATGCTNGTWTCPDLIDTPDPRASAVREVDHGEEGIHRGVPRERSEARA